MEISKQGQVEIIFQFYFIVHLLKIYKVQLC